MGIFKRHCKCQTPDRCAHPWRMKVMHQHQVHEVACEKWAKKPIKTKSDAQEAFALYKAAVLKGEEKREPDPKAFGPIAEAWLQAVIVVPGKDVQAAKSHIRAYIALWGERMIGQISLWEVEQFLLAKLKAGRAHATVRSLADTLDRIFTWATDREWLDKNPLRSQRTGKLLIALPAVRNARTRRLTLQEEQRLFALAGPQMQAWLIGALDTGLRRKELATLRNRHVDLERRLIQLPAEITKTNSARCVPILSERLHKLLTERATLGPEVLAFEPYASLNVFGHEWRRLLKLAGVSRDPLRGWSLHWHDLRHEWVSRLAERGVDFRKIQIMAGHTSSRMTARYDQQDLTGLVGKLDPLVGSETVQ